MDNDLNPFTSSNKNSEESIASSAPPQLQQTSPQVVQQINYVQTEKKSQGLSGWLMFFVVVFIFYGLGMLSYVVYNLVVPTNTALSVTNAIFAPLILAMSIISVVFIIMQLKAAKLTSLALHVLIAIYTVSTIIINAVATKPKAGDVAAMIVAVFTALIIYSLISLYFIFSKRAKATLINPIDKKIAKVLLYVVGGFSVLLLVAGLVRTLTTSADVDKVDSNNSSSLNNVANGSNKVKEVNVNEIISDSEMGYTIKVKRAIFNIPFDDGFSSYDNAMAVEIEVENNSEYDNNFYTSDIGININGEDKYSDDYGISEYIQSNNMTELPMSVAQGKKSSGWIFVQYNDTNSDINLSYNRSAMEVFGSNEDKIIPEKNVEIKLNK